MIEAPAVTIRAATEADRPRIGEMVRAFLAATPYGPRVSNTDAHVSELVTLGFAQGQIFLAEVDGRAVGMLAAMVYQHPLMGRRVATELLWWVDETERKSGAGLALLEGAEGWARSNGASVLECAEHTGRPSLARLYQRRGYAVREVIFEKDLQS